jgi:exopolysaccharide biosynthesis polyprenyl glycosylphosphotransferase
MFGKLRRLILGLLIVDLVLTQLALVVANGVRLLLPLGQEIGPSATTFLNPYLHLMALVLWPVVFAVTSVYDVRRNVRPVGEARTLFVAVSTATFALAGALYFTFRDVPRLLIVYFYFIDLLFLASARIVAGLLLRALHARGRPLTRVLIVGLGDASQAIALALETRLGHSILIVGYASDEVGEGWSQSPIVGKVAEVPRLAHDLAVDEVIICLPGDRYAEVEQLSFQLQTQPVRVRLVPDFLKLVMVQSSVDIVGGLPLIGLREPRIDGPAWAVKRTFDLLMTSLGLLLIWPFLLAIAIAIRLSSPGPIIFKQQRVGENGKLFWVYKFRTMVVGAEKSRLTEKQANDPRVTAIGRFLRKTSLDELPNLVNVLRGEMSLVGPRPEQVFIAQGYEPWQRQRLAVPPGMTGWWQVNGRSDLPMHLNTQYDLYYIRNYSLLLDLKILWKTIAVVINGKGAY